MSETVFITGATGYLGRALVPELLQRGHAVRALVRAASRSKLPAGCEAVVGDARDADAWRERVTGCSAFVQLVGVAHPGPTKGAAFRTVDGPAGLAGVNAAATAGVKNFVYVSVAQPAPVMRAYVDVRANVEAAIRHSGLHATILRPWYVLGPGHWWPILLTPFYRVLEDIDATRPAALRLGLVTLAQMTRALVAAVERPFDQPVRIWDVPAIRRGGEDE